MAYFAAKFNLCSFRLSDMQSPTNPSVISNNINYSNTIYYGVYVPIDAKDYSAGPYVFQDKVEALKLAKRNKKARFKAFQFYHEAAEFAMNGSECPNNNHTIAGLFTSKVSETTQTIGEKSSPFKGPKPQELVELRKAIETGNYKFVKDTIWQNPRYLVSNGDTPSILQEGPRYNALHVAAKSKNAEIAELILSTISNTEFIKLLYGDDNQQNAEDRTAVLLDLYLNTPNKGLNETPLHFAAKHGAPDVIELLVSYPQCDKNTRNKFHKTAAEIICERAEGNNIQAVKKRIQLLLQDSYYVPVLRAEDNSLPPTVGDPFSPTTPPVLNKDPLSPRLEIHAYAGPMDKKEAQEFRRVWKTPPRSLNFNSPNKKPNETVTVTSLRYKDPDKGLERIGKRLAKDYDVSWKEYWSFLGSFIDITSEEGLHLLEKYLSKRFSNLNDSLHSEMTNKDLDMSKGDILSPISSLCLVFTSACNLNDSCDQKVDTESMTYIDKACQVFANRISNDILHILCNEDNIMQVLEVEIKQLEYLITSYMEDNRFSSVNFQKIHSRLGSLVGQKLYNNIKEEARMFLCSKIENVLDVVTKSVDCFSSDDEGHHFKEHSENRKPTIYKKQLICLIHYVLSVLSQNLETKPDAKPEDCYKDWEEAEACLCIYHTRRSKKNSLSRNGSFKNSTRTFLKNDVDGRLVKRLHYDETDCDRNIIKNGLNVSLNSLKDLDISSDEDEMDSDGEDRFYTPPSSPSFLEDSSDSEDEFNDTQLPKYDYFIESDFPTKVDCDVFNAICYADATIDKEKYPNTYKWYHCISLYTKEEREKWPNLKDSKMTHSPDTSLSSSHCTDSPKSSTASRNWLRITGANSPKTALRSSPSRLDM
nr:unnamed protein product [Callosobruchus chinensis]